MVNMYMQEFIDASGDALYASQVPQVASMFILQVRAGCCSHDYI